MKLLVSVLFVIAAASAASSGNLGIINGRNALVGEFPAMVSIQRPGDFTVRPGFHMAGGFILDSTTIVTAASGVAGRRTINSVIAGIVNLTDAGTAQYVRISKITLHPDFDLTRHNAGLTSLNDIAVIKLATPLTLSSTVKAVTLPAQGAEIADGDDVTFAGWGWHLSGSWWYATNTLQVASYKTLNFDTCNTALKAITTADFSLSSTSSLCVGPLTDKDGLVNSSGDVGGALIQNGVAVGINSWNINYWATNPAVTTKGPAGVFTKVSQYVDWIKQNM